jgi:hypothetical protein
MGNSLSGCDSCARQGGQLQFKCRIQQGQRAGGAHGSSNPAFAQLAVQKVKRPQISVLVSADENKLGRLRVQHCLD